MTPTRTTHITACRAHAIGCAVENLRDAGDGRTSPVAAGDDYLENGTATCLCDRLHDTLVLSAPWIILGLAALDAAAG